VQFLLGFRRRLHFDYLVNIYAYIDLHRFRFFSFVRFLLFLILFFLLPYDLFFEPIHSCRSPDEQITLCFGDLVHGSMDDFTNIASRSIFLVILT
jgi:hypothetical protein